MPSTSNAPTSTPGLWAGRIITILIVLFMLFDSVLHLLTPAPVVQAFAELGYPIRLSLALGIIELICIAAYAFFRTSVLGAILLTGYLGGVVATQLRVGNPFFGPGVIPGVCRNTALGRHFPA